MPLPLPDLDDRRWADLVDEGRALIPRYAPEWTDHNLSDPGMTLLDLLAAMVERDLYRVNRIPDRHRRKFLALAGHRPAPPRSATVVLSVASGSATTVDLPAGTVVVARPVDGSGPPVPFRLTDPIAVTGVRLAAVQVQDGSEIRDRTALVRAGRPIEAFGPDPAATGADGPSLLLGLDAPGLPPAGRELSLWIDPGPGAPAAGPDDADLTGGGRAVVVWEVYDGTTWQPLTAGAVQDDTRALRVAGRVRIALPAPWPAVVLGEVAMAHRWLRARLVAGRPDAAPVVHRIAVDVAVGRQAVAAWSAYAVAPGIDLPDGPPVVGEHRRVAVAFDPEGRIARFATAADAGPKIQVLAWRPPAGGLDGSLALTLADAGAASGEPAAVVAVAGAPIDEGRAQVWSAAPATTTGPVDPNDLTSWATTPDLDPAGRADRWCTVDATTGAIAFGDGDRGRVPPGGGRILATFDRTSGAAGTPGPAHRWALAADDPRNRAAPGLLPGLDALAGDLELGLVAVLDPGADAEGIGEAAGRAAEDLWSHERLLEVAGGNPASLDQMDPAVVRSRPAPTRACTAIDFERLALAVPDTAVARARAWTGIDPTLPCVAAPGTVTVVVLPSLPAAAPQPTPGLLRAVRTHLAARQTLGTRLVVVGPTYVEAIVSATVRCLDGRDPDRVGADVEAAIDRYLHPLHGGSAGRGWPFGRDVHAAEMLRRIDEVPGVDHVTGLELSSGSTAGGCGSICVGPFSLVRTGAHRIEVT